MQFRENNPAPDSYAKSQLPHPSDHRRTARRLLQGAWFVIGALIGVSISVALGIAGLLLVGQLVAWVAGSPV
jgi:hypothetical protein